MVQFTYWQDEGLFIGYLNDYPDYLTQGKTLAELQENLKDILRDIAEGFVPCARKVMNLDIA